MTTRTLKLLLACGAMAIAVFMAVPDRAASERRAEASTGNPDGTIDDAKARAAFNEAAKVFFSPRCANCHPAGDTPTQGDNMTPHTMGVVRGTDGKGAPEQRCTTCHQEMNLEGEALPPGAPNWHMPAADQEMVFQGMTASRLCQNLKEPKTNGGRKTLKEAIHHVETDPLVKWAWSPGEGRTLPPLSHSDLLKKLNEWIDSGGACPE